MLTPGFIAAHSHRLEDLTDLAVQLLARYPLAPLEEEVILVQSNGIAQWLKQALASNTGIATMLEVTLPARLVWRAYRAILGADIPRQSPYDKSRLRWRLMRLLPDLMASHPDFTALKSYVANDTEQRKLFQLSDKLSDLFDQYQVYRADWLDAWTRGDAVLLQHGKSTPLAAEQRWQPALWQALVQDIGAEQICSNRAALHQRFLAHAAKLTAAGQRPAGIPPRIVVFGISSLPRQTLEVLHALKGLSQIVLCVHNPCKYHWADIVDGRELLNQYAKPRFSHKHQANPSLVSQAQLHQFAQPLLASWGKQGRDYIRLLDEFDETGSKAANFSELRFDLFDEAPANTLLARLQSDILNLRPVTESQAIWPAITDQSILFQRCHSPQREVEVLQDHLLAAFAADPSLQPRDVMVMVPDINSYAPYIDAVFGRIAPADSRFIPYSIADQGLRQRAPILQALELVLTAPQQRFGQSDVFDLLHVPAVQRRFGVTQEQVVRLQQWSTAAGARWGLNEQHRQALGLQHSFDENSWQFALNRMLYGYAVGDLSAAQANSENLDNPNWQQLEPYAEVAGIEAQAAGALAELITLLQHYWQALATSQSPADWHQLLAALLEQLFVPSNEAEQLLLSRLRDTLDEWLNSTSEAEFSSALRYNIVLEVWLAAVDEPNLQQRFMAGSVNFATLMPMRAIPFKRVCLLGMNDNDYPRASQKADFDLMAQHYRPGDRSRREDDRYLFLEAMLSARQQLYISWVGMSAQDNSEQPPSVLVGQLQDHLNTVWGAKCSESLTISHRLQPFAASYFNAAQPEYFSYANEWLAVYAVTPASEQAGAILPQLAPFVAEATFSLADLVILLKEPAQLLARRRLGVFLNEADNSQTDTEAFSVDGLAAWQIKAELMQQLLQNQPDSAADESSQMLERQLQRLRRRGHLPYKHGADEVLAQSKEAVLAIYQCYQRLCPPAALLVKPQRYQLSCADAARVPAAGAYLLEDELASLYQLGCNDYLQLELRVNKIAEKRPRSVAYTWRNLVSGYLKHLFACAVLAEGSRVQTIILGEDGVLTLASLSKLQATAQLENLLQGLAEALITPLPIALPLAEAWYQSRGKQQQVATDSDKVDDTQSEQLTSEQSAEYGYSAEALNKVYLGDEFNAGLLTKLPYLARYHPDADTLLQHGFVDYAQQLYLPFFSLLKAAAVTAVRQDGAVNGVTK
ncbi:RecBCD enzyme subunit RecC [Alishewanella longhuensis]|uniref:RecBCD enzyme subunit RecC n=2 Tax=Alishewanella longhuensis TaxID=1091037 RepID=A0ABQ3L2G8_9ALTE|nr:RecBCD enzyme subunit RecC [Alishewanella longhuensis]